MCGIAGGVTEAATDRLRTVRAMCAQQVHRGPDDEGYAHERGATLGMRRLSFIDVAGGHQPVRSESGRITAVFNGEIYNYRELQAHLRGRGHTLASDSDSEVIAHLYEEYGSDLVTHLRGMFAIALWDADTETLMLARDRLGKKPLYYRDDASGFWFASELKALLEAPGSVQVDPVAIHHYLTLQYVPAPWSAFDGISKLPPAHVLEHRAGRTEIRRYWQLEFAPQTSRPTSDREADVLAEELRGRLTECVEARLMSERPLGAFLSGGLDSSAIVAAMTSLTGEGVPTFAVGFEDPDYDESGYARDVAKHFQTDHHELILDPEIASTLPSLAAQFGEPFADSSAVPSLAVARLARGHVVGALNGDGGDEAFGGYRRYAFLASQDGHRIPAFLAPPLTATASALARASRGNPWLSRVSRGVAALSETEPSLRYARLMSYFQPEQKAALYLPDFADRVASHSTFDLLATEWKRADYTDPVNRLLAVDTATYLPGDLLAKVDITTMAVSLEARSPLLDHTLIEWAASLPGDVKVRKGQTKWLMRRALQPWLPDAVIHRRKQGFGVPIHSWLRGPLLPLLRDVTSTDTVRHRGIFRPEQVALLREQHLAGHDHSSRLWALLMLELWWREVVDS